MWQRIPVCFEFVSPLHVGFLPNVAGTLVAPTRLYVPGSNFWGAITAALTPRLFPSARPADFERVGKDLKRAVRFSYFYLSDGSEVFFPSFETGELRWGTLSDSDFRANFAESRLSTKIGSDGTSEDAALHEIEYVRHRTGNFEGVIRRTLLCGVFWLGCDSKICERQITASGSDLTLRPDGNGKQPVDLLDNLALGGERNYGFGRIRPATLASSIREELEKAWPEDPESPMTAGRPLLGHMQYGPEILFRGAIEVVASREYPSGGARSYVRPGRALANAGHFFAPGTVVSMPGTIRFDEFGRTQAAIGQTRN